MGATIDIRPISGALGAEIRGVNLSDDLSDDVIAVIRKALLDHLVVFFRDQSLTIDEHKRFGARFGDFHYHPIIKGPPDHPELLVLKNDRENRPTTNQWHSDVTCDAQPPMGSILIALEVPEAGGDTLWSNMYLAYETLSASMKTYLTDLTATHSFRRFFEASILKEGGYEALAKAIDEHPPVHHPVIRTHPETGRKALFVNSIFTDRIDGVPKREGEAVLRYLLELAESPDFTCRFAWRRGSVAFWDNRCTQHFALADYWPQERHMRRVTIAGDKPA